jgi:hypothetical protein
VAVLSGISDPNAKPPAQGYSTTNAWSQAYAEGRARIEAMNAAAPTLHPSERARLRAEQEARVEAERRSVDWPGKLRAAHQAYRQSSADLQHHRTAVERARGVAGEIATRIARLESTLQAGDAAAAARLVEAISAGAQPTIGQTKNDGIAAALTHARREANIAGEALATLEGELARIEKAAAAAGASVRSAVADLMIDQMVAESSAILEGEAALAAKKEDLYQASRVITDETRRAASGPRRLPPVISRAIARPTDQAIWANTVSASRPVTTNWREIFERLCADPDFGQEPDAPAEAAA